MADNLYGYSSSEQPCEKTYSSSNIEGDPELYGYMRLRNNSDGSGSGEEDEDLEEFAAQTDCQQQSTVYGTYFDEEISVESSSSSEELSSLDVKVTSASKVQGESFPEIGRRLEVCHDYDEEHTVQSSSSETSPREEPERNIKNVFSRHSYSSGSPPTAVDAGLKLPISSQATGSLMSSYNGLRSSSSTNPRSRLEHSFAPGTGKTVRGMSIGKIRSTDVRLDMGDVDVSSYSPGGILHKNPSTTARDASPMLSALDKRGIAPREMSDMSQPGYDHRRYGSRDSLEHQHPERHKSSSYRSEGSSTSTHSRAKTGPSRTGFTSTSAESTNELDKRKLRRNKKVESAKNSWTKADDKLGRMKIDDILDYLGEKNTGIVTGKKKKERRDMPKEGRSNDKKHERDKYYKKREYMGNNGKRRSGTQVAGESNVSTSSSQLSPSKSEITQTTSNNHVMSRIILHGGDETGETIGQSLGVTYSERNIDEAIEQSKSLTTKSESDVESVTESSATELADKQDKVESTTPLVSQTISVTYNVNLAPEPFCLVGHFGEVSRTETVELAEGEFKQVVHKKKKIHSKQPGTERDGATAIVAPTVSEHFVTSKPVSKLSPKVKGPPVSNNKAMSPTRKFADNLTEQQSFNTEAQYDFCEKSFPTLSGDHKPQVAMVSPFCSSWAAKVASNSTSSVQLTTSYKGAGDGDQCTDSKSFPSLDSCLQSQVTTTMLPPPMETIENGSVVLDKDSSQSEESSITNTDPLTESAVDTPTVDIEKTHSDSLCSPIDRTLEDRPTSDNGNAQKLVEECVVSPRIAVPASAPRTAKKSTKVVEFVGRSFNEKHKTSSPNIQFGFISNEILSQTSLGPQEEEHDVTNTSTNHSDTKSLDVLPYLLKMENEPTQSFPYPIFLRKSVQMLKKEFNTTIQQWKKGTVDEYGGPKVLRWSPDL